jgi:hypothetical protein
VGDYKDVNRVFLIWWTTRRYGYRPRGELDVGIPAGLIDGCSSQYELEHEARRVGFLHRVEPR